MPALAVADIRYAAPDGDGPEATCPAADPCNLSIAVEGPSVANGDEVVVLPGRHQLPGDDPLDGFIPNNPLYVAKAIHVHGPLGGPAPTIVSGPDGGSVYIDAPGAIVSDLAIEGGLGLDTGTAERVNVYQPTGSLIACLFDKYSLVAEPPPLIRDSVCRANDAGAFGNAGVAVSLRPSSPRTLTAQLVNVTAIGTTGIYVLTGSGSSAAVEATNVVAIGIDGTDVGAITSGSPGGDGAAASISLANSNYRTVNVSGPAAAATPAGSGTNQTAAPILASPATGDVRQVIGSPTIDAGAAVPLLGSFDFEGQARVQGPAPDIGADEGSIATPFTLSAAARRALRDLGVTVRCETVFCGFRIRGSIRLKGGKADRAALSRSSFELKQRALTLPAGERRKVKLKLDASSRKKVEKLLEDGAKAEAVIDVDTGDGGFADRARVRIKGP